MNIISNRITISFLIVLLPCIALASETTPAVHHDLNVELNPDESSLVVKDSITFPEAVTSIEFMLHGGLRLESLTNSAVLTKLGRIRGPVPVDAYRVRFSSPSHSFKVRYAGRIHHPLQSPSGRPGDRRRSTPGDISKQGVFLGAASYWYPVIADRLVVFRMKSRLPAGWTAVSQGKTLPESSTWAETNPQDEIYLIAAEFHRYLRKTEVAEAQVYLRTPDPNLADRYLRATEQYLQLYSRLIGPYPYSKFALVENFWESGYGMPSFTLLGPGVIRLPFILHSSYPHEILHNWWGNSVYVDYAKGNWSEGLTSYLADHLIREQQGKGAAYRRDTLQKYADYVAEENDFPLEQFRGRHGEASQAVGYGKTLMLLHMLRRQLGDRRFIEGLRLFYDENRFRTAGFDDLRLALEKAGGQDLSYLFRQWTTRTGAPRLELHEPGVEESSGGYRLTGQLRQVQPEPAFRIRVPIFIQLQGETELLQINLEMSDKQLPLDILLKKRPLRITVDPEFDLFRRPDPSEIPSSLGQLFGAEEMTLILPSAAPEKLRQAYQDLAATWSNGVSGINRVWDNKLKHLPKDDAVWILGSENLFTDDFYQAAREQVNRPSRPGLELEGRDFSVDQFSFAMTARVPDRPEQAIALLSLHDAEAMPGLARKLPHYSKYSYTLFEGDRPTNVLKGQWQVTESALSIDLTEGESHRLIPIPDSKPLTDSLGVGRAYAPTETRGLSQWPHRGAERRGHPPHKQ